MLINQTSILLFISVVWHEILSFKSNMRPCTPQETNVHQEVVKIIRPCEHVYENIWNAVIMT